MRRRGRVGHGFSHAGVLLALMIAFASVAEATNGYFTHGYGTTSKGLAGAGVALPQDALTVATNPAGLAFLGKRRDVGLAIFNPNREYTIQGAPSRFPGTFGLAPGTVESDSEIFGVPYVGLAWEVGAERRFGLAIYGHGGMNTDYPTSTFFGSAPTGVDLSQLFVVPTYAFKIGSSGRHGFGISAIVAYQRFEIRGVEAFRLFSGAPGQVSNNGHDESVGFGLKLGYLGRLTSRFSYGLSYQSEIQMEEFDAYAGLFAERGGFDIPATFTVGFAVQASDRVTVAFDVQEIFYSDVNAVGNPLLPNLVTSPLGTDQGAGFGWEDMTIFKLGVQWDAGDWIWRAGFSTGDQPIPESEVLFNILAPGVMEEHVTLGFTRKLRNGRAVSFAFMHAFSSSVRGANPLEVPGLQQIELEMNQYDLEIGYSWGF